MSDLLKLLFLLFLKSTPQDLSYSSRLTLRLLLAYVFSGFIVLQATLNPDDILAGILLGLFVQFAFVYLVLKSLSQGSRFLQTFCAILGIGVFFNLFLWPVFSVLSDASTDEALKSTMSFVFLMLISWEILVKAHIFRHALEMKMFSALALSFSLLFISVALSQLMFPAEVAA